MKLQKIGGVASILNTILILILLVIILLVQPRLGLVGPNALYDTAAVLDAMATSPITFFIVSLLIALCGIPYIFIALGIKERMQDRAPALIQVLIIVVSIACALWLAAATIGLFGLPWIAQTKDISSFSTAFAMHFSLVLAGDSAAGWVLLIIGWAGLRTGGLPKSLCYLTLLKAIVMILEVAVQPIILQLIGVFLGIPFYPWLGIVLLRKTNYVERVS